jgi:release factor glutamine methyltransferase
VTVAQALAAGITSLEEASASARADVRLLLTFVLGCERSELLVHDDAEIGETQRTHLEALVAERRRGVPVAYLVGCAWFYGRPFEVTRDVLVPRPETEHLIEAAIDDLRGEKKTSGILVDVGTGSGAIAITLACELPELTVFATDISGAAIAVARRNAVTHGVTDRCTFLHGDLLAPLDDRTLVDCIVANLPYVPSDDVPAAPNPVAFEPLVAVDGGPDGLAPYRRLLEQIPFVARPGANLLLEAAPATIDPLAALVEAAFPDAHITIGEDYAGCDRYLQVSLPG